MVYKGWIEDHKRTSLEDIINFTNGLVLNGIKNLFSIYIPIVDELMIFDNSQMKSELIASKSNDSSLIIRNEQKFNYLKSYYEKA